MSQSGETYKNVEEQESETKGEDINVRSKEGGDHNVLRYFEHVKRLIGMKL